MIIFDVGEIIDMGIEKEKKRRDFYALVAQRFPEKEMQDLFTRLRDWEETHIRKFTEIRQGVKESDTAESYPGELESYMNALVDDRLYKEVSPDQFSNHVRDPVEAIKYGLSFEKDAILFFNELLPYVQSPNKEPIQKLINEEKQHIVYLSDLRKKLKA
ncbi:hypothetical protein AMJ40_00840 [candidate division TA06 bacterium DG_26]|uniref:Rubrerythrin diiron-binding domain-containing protein n=1 Tax=candidate division TA06 bacterium DG_26 TaxID=1703771 RepID=A0A0S7WLZ1_UNCT6|nr:MAG: hypothetical protein AMJ40_00840 [candidate division TA06 bacterium DG_26]